MTEHPVHNEPFHKTMTVPSASRRRSRALVGGSLLVAALIGASLWTHQSGLPKTHQSELANKAAVNSPRYEAVPTVETMKIVPADPLGRDAPWSPLTGDGSN